MKPSSKITLTMGQLQKLVNETVFDQKELRALAEEEGDEVQASVDKQALWDKIYQVLKQEALDFSSNYTQPLELWDIDVITREDRDEYQAGDASPGSEYGYAVKWGYDAAVDIALEDHEWTYVMVYEEPEDDEEAENQYTFDDVVNIITRSYLRDRYEEIQCGSFEHGHFKYIVFVDNESKAKTALNENTKFTLTIGQLKRLVKESGMTIEDAFDQMEQDVRKAKYAYLKGEVAEASNTVFEIIEDAKGISNRLTETTGGPLMESKGKPNVKRVACDATANVIDEAVQLAMEFAKVMDNVPDGLYDTIQPTDIENEKTCLSVVMGMRDAAKACQHTFGTGSKVQGLDDFVTSAQLFIDHWQKELEPYLDVPFESKQHNKRK